DAPSGVERISVRSADQMRRTVLEKLPEATIVVMAAAVADYRPIAPEPQKIKRGAPRLTLELEATPDILAEVARNQLLRAPGAVIVGFAAETDRVAEHARRKLADKAADIIVANDVTAEGAGFDHSTNVVTLFGRDGSETPLPRMSKFE